MKQLILIAILIFPGVNLASEKITLDGKTYLNVADDSDKKLADQYIAAKDYKQAMATYKELASIGDKYSQYQISNMYQQGLGVEQSNIKAYVWASLAAEDKNPKLIQYKSDIVQQLSARELQESKAQIQVLSKEFGNIGVAKKIKKWIYRSLPKCTGSRIRGSGVACLERKSSCYKVEHVEHVEHLKFRIDPSGDIGKHCYMSMKYLEHNQLSSLKKAYNHISKYIRNYPKGTVKAQRIDS